MAISNGGCHWLVGADFYLKQFVLVAHFDDDSHVGGWHWLVSARFWWQCWLYCSFDDGIAWGLWSRWLLLFRISRYCSFVEDGNTHIETVIDWSVREKNTFRARSFWFAHWWQLVVIAYLTSMTLGGLSLIGQGPFWWRLVAIAHLIWRYQGYHSRGCHYWFSPLFPFCFPAAPWWAARVRRMCRCLFAQGSQPVILRINLYDTPRTCSFSCSLPWAVFWFAWSFAALLAYIISLYGDGAVFVSWCFSPFWRRTRSLDMFFCFHVYGCVVVFGPVPGEPNSWCIF